MCRLGFSPSLQNRTFNTHDPQSESKLEECAAVLQIRELTKTQFLVLLNTSYYIITVQPPVNWRIRSTIWSKKNIKGCMGRQQKSMC